MAFPSEERGASDLLLGAASDHAGDVELPAAGRELFDQRMRALAVSDPADPRVHDVFLAIAAGFGDAAAIARIDEELRRLLPAARRLGLSDADLEDVAQTLRVRLFSPTPPGEGIRGFQGRGPLGAWLRAAVIKTAVTCRQKQQRFDALRSAEDAFVQVLFPDKPSDDRLDQREAVTIVRQVLYQALGELDDDDKRLLRANVLDGVSIDRLAAQENVHRATVARRIARACRQLRRAMVRHLAEVDPAAAGDAGALVAWAESQLDLSLSRLLPKS